MIYAGVDSNGTDHNVNAWVVPGGGAGLVREGDGLRVCQLRNGQVTPGIANPMSYNRPRTRDTFTVPFEVSGEIMLHSRATDPIIFGTGLKPHWTWGVSFHPVFVDENNNIVTGFAPGSTNWGASGQIDGKYGIARAERYTPPFNHDAQLDGRWHRWRMVVPAVGVHEVHWDDVLVYRVVEKSPPAAWWDRPLRAGLRLDYYDYSLRNLTPSDSEAPMIPGVSVFHPREAWQDPAWPVVGPPANQAAIDTAVIHYTAASKIPADLFRFHRDMQYAYAKPKAQGGRGYSLGYRHSVVSGGVRDGEVFQIRGFDIKSAANAGHNEHTEPILVLVDGDDPATPAAVRSVRAIIAESQRRSGRTFTITGHGQLSGAATSCPGVGLRAQIAAGVFAPRPKPPQPTPIQGAPDVFYPINPFRNSDTRAFGGPGVAPGVDHVFDLNSGVFPAGTTAVALNVVAVGAAAPGFVTVWPDGQPQPNTSIINFRGDGGAYNGAIVVGVSGGKFRLEASATCHVIIDVTGYWTA